MSPSVGERLLTSKLQILAGAGGRRPGLALGILTGRVSEPTAVADLAAGRPVAADPRLAPPPLLRKHQQRQFAARTVYLSERDLADIEHIMDAGQHTNPRRLTRSAIVRRAVAHLRTSVDATSAKFLLETD